MFPSPAATRTIQRDCNKESTMISESATILIVEDEQDIRELLAYNLEKEGYATVQAADGKEGLELARSRKPDLILLDLMLPKMDGLAVCRTRLRHGAHPHHHADGTGRRRGPYPRLRAGGG